MILALHLKRFKYMEQLQRYTKLSYRVVFPLELRLFNTSGDATNPERLYDLVAVVVHCGRCVGANTQLEYNTFFFITVSTATRDRQTNHCSKNKMHLSLLATLESKSHPTGENTLIHRCSAVPNFFLFLSVSGSFSVCVYTRCFPAFHTVHAETDSSLSRL